MGSSEGSHLLCYSAMNLLTTFLEKKKRGGGGGMGVHSGLKCEQLNSNLNTAFASNPVSVLPVEMDGFRSRKKQQMGRGI